MIAQDRVRGGRLVLDEPTTLPEGATVDVDAGRTVSAPEALRRIRTG